MLDNSLYNYLYSRYESPLIIQQHKKCYALEEEKKNRIIFKKRI